MATSVGGWIAAITRRRVLRALDRELARVGAPFTDDLHERIGRAAGDVAARHPAPDQQTRAIIDLSSLVLAAYRELVSSGMTREDSFELLLRALVTAYQRPLRMTGRALQLFFAFTRDPTRQMGRWTPRAMRWGPRLFGQAMEFDWVVADGRVEWHITRCPYHEFFVAEGEPLLTQIFSHLDVLWMQEASRSRRSVVTERPRTLSTGGDRCAFCFVRADGPSTHGDDVVLERWSEVQVALRAQDDSVG